MPRSGHRRPVAESRWGRSLSSQASLQLAAHPDRARMRVRSTDVLRDTRSFLVAWGMAMTRLVLLVVDDLCHVILHFSCSYEMGAGSLHQARGGSNGPVVLGDLMGKRWRDALKITCSGETVHSSGIRAGCSGDTGIVKRPGICGKYARPV